MTSRPTFASVILLDGAIYFICLFILKFESNIVLFTEPLTSILIWRFMLDLQTVNSGNYPSRLPGCCSRPGVLARRFPCLRAYGRFSGILCHSKSTCRRRRPRTRQYPTAGRPASRTAGTPQSRALAQG
ncbi:hypothetical protein BD310DRAFT_153992 [Dichomitus squalens]|uniref:Uncharacterized protein n=1 Tax=Dichomitus squalens TaxID=114155 RepID=A0A4Q9Q3T6_9APHY|nr:hypothetical protein BD310DRAFT_153992 [Dichomitus squalens]